MNPLLSRSHFFQNLIDIVFVNSHMLIGPANEAFEFAMPVEGMASFTVEILLRHPSYDRYRILPYGAELLGA